MRSTVLPSACERPFAIIRPLRPAALIALLSRFAKSANASARNIDGDRRSCGMLFRTLIPRSDVTISNIAAARLNSSASGWRDRLLLVSGVTTSLRYATCRSRPAVRSWRAFTKGARDFAVRRSSPGSSSPSCSSAKAVSRARDSKPVISWAKLAICMPAEASARIIACSSWASTRASAASPNARCASRASACAIRASPPVSCCIAPDKCVLPSSTALRAFCAAVTVAGPLRLRLVRGVGGVLFDRGGPVRWPQLEYG